MDGKRLNNSWQPNVYDLQQEGKKGIDPCKIYPLDDISREYIFTELVKSSGYG